MANKSCLWLATPPKVTTGQPVVTPTDHWKLRQSKHYKAAWGTGAPQPARGLTRWQGLLLVVASVSSVSSEPPPEAREEFWPAVKPCRATLCFSQRVSPQRCAMPPAGCCDGGHRGSLLDALHAQRGVIASQGPGRPVRPEPVAPIAESAMSLNLHWGSYFKTT